MNLAVSQLRDRVAAQFSDVEAVGESIIRFTRKAGDLAFAVYYLDVTQDLPSTEEELRQYQDRVIGRRYFEGRKSLQWSNYLYFVIDMNRLASSEVRLAKELIERDRTYARKFVIAEEELDSVLTSPIAEPADTAPQINVLSIWMDRLIEAGLDRAVLSEEALPKRLQLIEAPTTAVTSPRVLKPKAKANATAFIRSFQLKNYRKFPLQRRFDFGMVNLIFGSNASGKTSLLEALELFYCGRNKRNRINPQAYELIAELVDGRIKKATADRRLALFRSRNFAWYGKPEVKTNNLCLSFAQFNFLDTDAAVSLSDSTARIEDDLSKLLVGQDASKTWHSMERVLHEVSSKVRELQPLSRQIHRELSLLERQLQELSAISKESDAIKVRLAEMAGRLGWKDTLGDNESSLRTLVESLSELISLAEQTSALEWMESPVSVNTIDNYSINASQIIEQTELLVPRLERQQENQKRLSDEVRDERVIVDLVNEASRLVEAGVPRRVAELKRSENVVATYSNWLAGLDDAIFERLFTVEQDHSVASIYEASVAERSAAQALLENTKTEYANFARLREQSLNLSQELREVAAKILEHSSEPDQCPLCHTRFETGQLGSHIQFGVDEDTERLGQTLLGQVRSSEEAARDRTTVELACEWLKGFCERANIPAESAAYSAIATVAEAKIIQGEARNRIETLTSELLGLESQGLSVTRVQDISDGLRTLGCAIPEFSRVAVDELLSRCNQRLNNLSTTLENETTEVNESLKEIQAALGSTATDIRILDRVLSRTKERLTVARRLKAKLSHFSLSFPWSAARPLAELSVEAESIRKVAASLQTALGQERLAQTTHAELVDRKQQLEKQRDDLRPRLARYIKAQAVLDRLTTDYSLTAAMKVALTQNRAGIESIFSRIHSPAEFRSLGSTWTTLVRKIDGSEASLGEMSTGQRAAFALSIFMAQNAQLTEAPPVVLIDDPIAHIDDLNSLSFLDYLREVVLKGRRQIFFATANEKLATLFERKFDFLEEEFRRHDLPPHESA